MADKKLLRKNCSDHYECSCSDTSSTGWSYVAETLLLEKQPRGI